MTLFYFPQWQGAGDAQRYPLYPSAEKIRDYVCNGNDLLEAEMQDIPLDGDTSLQLEQGIFGRRALLQQLDNAMTVVGRADPSRLGLIGGDCAVELAPVSHLNRLYGDSLALLWVDAHADLNLPETSPSHALHGMPLRMLLGEGDTAFVERLHPLSTRQVCLVGVRDLDAPEQAFIEQSGLALFPAVGLQVDIPAICRLLRSRGLRQVYVHLDLDALDPAMFPQVGFPADGGLSVAAIAGLLDALEADFDLVGFSMTEYLSPQGEGLHVLQPLLDVLAGFVFS